VLPRSRRAGRDLRRRSPACGTPPAAPGCASSRSPGRFRWS